MPILFISVFSASRTAQHPGDSQEKIVGWVNERAPPLPHPTLREGPHLPGDSVSLPPGSDPLPSATACGLSRDCSGGPGPGAPWSCRQRRLPTQHRVSEAWPLSVSTDARGSFRLCEVLGFEEASGCQEPGREGGIPCRGGGSRRLPQRAAQEKQRPHLERLLIPVWTLFWTKWGAAAKGILYLVLLFFKQVVSVVSDLCDSMDCSPPGFSVYGILQQEYRSGLPCPPPGGSFPSRNQTCVPYVSCIGRWVLYPRCHLGSPFNRRLTENILGWPKSSFNVGGNANELFGHLNVFLVGGGSGVFKVYLFMVCWVFVAVHKLSLVSESRSYSSCNVLASLFSVAPLVAERRL